MRSFTVQRRDREYGSRFERNNAMNPKPNWRRANVHTAWQGNNIVVFRDDVEIDRMAASDIARVVIVYTGAGESPGALSFALIETGDAVVMLSAQTGIAGRIHFERLAFWVERRCIYWVAEVQAQLPLRLHRRSAWFFRRAQTPFQRLPRSEIGPLIDGWPLQGPQTWDERKWQRIERSRPFFSEPSDPTDRRH